MQASGRTRLTGPGRTAAVHPRSARLPCPPPSASFFSKLLGGQQQKDKAADREPAAPSTSERTTLDRLLTPGSEVTTEFPPYTVVAKTADYALRLYDVFPVVEMSYQRREEGYGALGSYFDGGNAQGGRFAYTAPVVMVYYPDGRKSMQMFVGKRRGGEAAPSEDGGASTTGGAIASLPAPSNAAVRISVAGGELVAVAAFDGFITPTTSGAVRQRLIAALERDGIQLAEMDAQGRFRCAQYGAVYQLGGRLNELMLQVRVS